MRVKWVEELGGRYRTMTTTKELLLLLSFEHCCRCSMHVRGTVVQEELLLLLQRRRR
jgi:hypothetical protein